MVTLGGVLAKDAGDSTTTEVVSNAGSDAPPDATAGGAGAGPATETSSASVGTTAETDGFPWSLVIAGGIDLLLVIGLFVDRRRRVASP
jgi:hypothetical protein